MRTFLLTLLFVGAVGALVAAQTSSQGQDTSPPPSAANGAPVNDTAKERQTSEDLVAAGQALADTGSSIPQDIRGTELEKLYQHEPPFGRPDPYSSKSAIGVPGG